MERKQIEKRISKGRKTIILYRILSSTLRSDRASSTTWTVEVADLITDVVKSHNKFESRTEAIEFVSDLYDTI